MKLNMSKVYNRVEWIFLCRLMENMGFENHWIQLIYGCISSVSYSILVNGEPHGDIKPTRGLRQGNPLSPYLFLLVSEGLNGLIQQAMATSAIRGFFLCRNGPWISHLFFADDTLLFCKLELKEVQIIQNLLKKYEGFIIHSIPSHELVSRHIHKLVQVSNFVFSTSLFGFCLCGCA